MTLKKTIKSAQRIIRRFEKIEGKPWKIEGSMIELSKQVGDLAKLVLSMEGYYPENKSKSNKSYLATKEKIADELADIFFMILRISDYYGIDIEEAHKKTSQKTDKYLKKLGV